MFWGFFMTLRTRLCACVLFSWTSRTPMTQAHLVSLTAFAICFFSQRKHFFDKTGLNMSIAHLEMGAIFLHKYSKRSPKEEDNVLIVSSESGLTRSTRSVPVTPLLSFSFLRN